MENLKPSGYCNICDDLVEEMKKKHEGTTEKSKSFHKGELDFKTFNGYSQEAYQRQKCRL